MATGMIKRFDIHAMLYYCHITDLKCTDGFRNCIQFSATSFDRYKESSRREKCQSIIRIYILHLNKSISFNMPISAVQFSSFPVSYKLYEVRIFWFIFCFRISLYLLGFPLYFIYLCVIYFLSCDASLLVYYYYVFIYFRTPRQKGNEEQNRTDLKGAEPQNCERNLRIFHYIFFRSVAIYNDFK